MRKRLRAIAKRRAELVSLSEVGRELIAAEFKWITGPVFVAAFLLRLVRRRCNEVATRQ